MKKKKPTKKAKPKSDVTEKSKAPEPERNDDHNPYGGLPARDLKKNLGC